MITVTYGKGFELKKPESMRSKVENLQAEISKLPQYEPITNHTFHAGMYCREVWRKAGALIVGRVHKKEHFYLVASGTVVITTDDGIKEVTGPTLIKSMPGTKRAVYALTDATCMTFHATDLLTPEDAESEFVESEEVSLFDANNKILLGE